MNIKKKKRKKNIRKERLVLLYYPFKRFRSCMIFECKPISLKIDRHQDPYFTPFFSIC